LVNVGRELRGEVNASKSRICKTATEKKENSTLSEKGIHCFKQKSKRFFRQRRNKSGKGLTGLKNHITCNLGG